MKDPLDETGTQVTRRGVGVALLLVLLGLVLLAVLRPSTVDTLLIVFGLIVLIMAHEAGHYVAAKRAGMKVTEFFLGFGPRIWSFRRGETEYGVKALPAGGYVRIVGMNNLEEVDASDEPRTYRQASFTRRLVVVLAGVTVNFVLAYFLIYAALLGNGLPDILREDVKQVQSESPAAAADVRQGDRIVSVQGEPLTAQHDIGAALHDRAGVPTTIVVEREGQRITLDVTPKARSRSDHSGIIGVVVDQRVATYRSVSPIGGVGETFRTMGRMTADTARGFGRLFSPAGLERFGKNFTNDAPKAGSRAAQDRPVSALGIVYRGGQIVGGNAWNLLLLLGAINLIVALLNTLPLLPFDGGHAAVAIYEQIASKVRRREVRVDFRRLIPVTALVLAVFLTLGLSTMFLDLRDIFTGG